jgi:hypothetical protein
MGVVWRYIWAAVGGFLALGGYAWVNLPTQAIFQASSSGIAVSTGLTFAFFTGFLALLAGEFPGRLGGFWAWGSRLVIGLLLGAVWGTLTWAAFTWFFLNYPPDYNVMALGGVGLALGFIVSSLLRLPGWLAVIVTTAAVYTPIYVAFVNYLPPILYFRSADPNVFEAVPFTLYTQGVWVALMIALGGHAQALWHDIRRAVAYLRTAI